MTNREKLQSLAEQRSTQRQIDSAQREQENAAESRYDSLRTAELVSFFSEDVTGFKLFETQHELYTELIDKSPEYDLMKDGVPYVVFSIRDDKAPGVSVPLLVVRFRQGTYKYWTMRRDGELATLDELRDAIHGEIADMDALYAGDAVSFSRQASETDDDEDFGDEFDDEYDEDFDDERCVSCNSLIRTRGKCLR